MQFDIFALFKNLVNMLNANYDWYLGLHPKNDETATNETNTANETNTTNENWVPQQCTMTKIKTSRGLVIAECLINGTITPKYYIFTKEQWAHPTENWKALYEGKTIFECMQAIKQLTQ